MDDNKVKGFAAAEASTYDEDSLINKGNRLLHRNYLKLFLTYVKTDPKSFMDLGCGTCYFSEVFTEVFPEIKGLCIDGSSEMLAKARERFGDRFDYQQNLFEEIKWNELGNNDLIFSALAIHHMTHESKWEIFQSIYDNLNDDGIFILFDFFKSDDLFENELLEYLSCKNMQTKILENLGIDFVLDELKIEKIIENDRNVKALEGDNEAPLDAQIENLKKAGFKKVVTIFQDTRLAGIVSYK